MSHHIKDGNAINPCTGCAMCAAVCPPGAIAIGLGQEGFYVPSVNADKCSDCGLCQSVCYRYDRVPIQETACISCCSAVNKDNEELLSASSGAVSIELMRRCLIQGYKIVGVAYDSESEIAVTRIAETAEQLKAFKGSKYFQSRTAEAFRQVIQDKTPQKYAVFGTPCQIYAFSRAADLMHNREKYLLVDIFCHGCPSMHLWKKYLAFCCGRFGVDRLDAIAFRSKIFGWHGYSFDFRTDKKTFHSSRYSDPFYELFFGMDLMNTACYDCVLRSSLAYTDIRLGDFWGRQFDGDNRGVSAVVLHTQQGKDLFDEACARFSCRQFPLEEVLTAQSYGKPHRCQAYRREQTLKILAGGEPLEAAVTAYRKMMPVRARIRRVLKQAAKRLPKSWYLGLKRKINKR